MFLAETIAFSLLGALIRSYVTNDQIILMLLCVFTYVLIFRSYNQSMS